MYREVVEYEYLVLLRLTPSERGSTKTKIGPSPIGENRFYSF